MYFLSSLFNVQRKYLFVYGSGNDPLISWRISKDGFTTLSLSFCFRNFSTILIIPTLSSQPKMTIFLLPFVPFLFPLFIVNVTGFWDKKATQWNITWLITSTWRHIFCIFLPSCLMVTSQYHIHSIACALLHRYWYRCANLSEQFVFVSICLQPIRIRCGELHVSVSI